MKYLKKFNEELKPQTYFTASKKLRKLGHERRAGELETWGKEVESHESIQKWKSNIEKYSKWGKANFKFLHSKKIVPQFTGDFYLAFIFDDFNNSESIADAKEGTKGYFNFSIGFSVGLIPVDEETLQKCKENFPDNDFGNGFFWGLWVNVDYKVEDSILKFDKIQYFPYDESLTLNPQIMNRRGALSFKDSLMACFDENADYPSQDTRFHSMCQALERCLIQQLNLDDYGFDIEGALNDIKNYSHNYYYKD